MENSKGLFVVTEYLIFVSIQGIYLKNGKSSNCTLTNPLTAGVPLSPCWPTYSKDKDSFKDRYNIPDTHTSEKSSNVVGLGGIWSGDRSTTGGVVWDGWGPRQEAWYWLVGVYGTPGRRCWRQVHSRRCGVGWLDVSELLNLQAAAGQASICWRPAWLGLDARQRGWTNESLTYLVVKFQLTEDAAYLKIFSLYSILIYHASSTRVFAAMSFEKRLVTHEE